MATQKEIIHKVLISYIHSIQNLYIHISTIEDNLNAENIYYKYIVWPKYTKVCLGNINTLDKVMEVQ